MSTSYPTATELGSIQVFDSGWGFSGWGFSECLQVAKGLGSRSTFEGHRHVYEGAKFMFT